MKYFVVVFLFVSIFSHAQLHCGFDFTSYLVVKPHENGKNDHISNLRITVVDSLGNDLVNVEYKYSWKNNNKVLEFTENYKIDEQNNKWFFPYAKESYLLTVTNDFQAEQFRLKIEDISGKYETQFIDLYSFNMYILCAAENEKQARQFGPRTNNPIDVVLEKK